MKHVLGIITFAVVAVTQYVSNAPAQTSPPGSDIYLAPLTLDEGSPVVGRPLNVTNRNGYDNQPYFFPGGTYFLFVSMDTSGQTDIYRYDIVEGSTTRITDTPESEYSPTPVPGGGYFSSVRVEADGAQRLWRFDLDGRNPRLILTAVDSVGYHAWLDDNTLGLFVLGEPHTLRIADRRTDTDRVVAFDIGRSLHAVPGAHRLSFVNKISQDEWWIRQFDPTTGEFERLADTLPQSEDFVWTPGGDILMAQGSVLFLWTGDDAWIEVAGLRKYALTNITRLAVDPDGRWLALVADDA